MPTPDMLPTSDLAALLVARDAALTAWRRGAMDEASCRRRLAALAAPDVDGWWWRLRPSQEGAVFVRLGPGGEVQVVSPAQYRPPVQGIPPWVRWVTWGAAAVWLVLWLAALAAFSRGGA